MNKLENWTEVTKGLYRYVIATNFCYEILITSYYERRDILTAKANVYAVGTWDDKEGALFDRELIGTHNSVYESIQIAVKDYKENCKEE